MGAMAERVAADSGVVDLGVVSLAASPHWRFYPMDDRLIGRPLIVPPAVGWHPTLVVRPGRKGLIA